MISRLSGSSETNTWDKADANTPSRRTTQCFEMFGPRDLQRWLDRLGIVGGWVLLNGALAIVRLTRRDRPKASAKLMARVLKGERWTPRSAMMPDAR